MDADDLALCKSAGMTDNQIKALSTNEKLWAKFGLMLKVAPESGAVLFSLAQKLKPNVPEATLELLARKVGAGDLDKLRVQAASKLANEAAQAGTPLTAERVDEACGVGVVVDAKALDAAVAAVIEENRADLLEKRYRFPSAKLIPVAVGRLLWVEAADVRTALEKQVAALLGPKTEADLAKPEKPKKGKGADSGGGGGGGDTGKGKETAATAGKKKSGGQLDPTARKGAGASTEAAVGGEGGEGLEFPSPSANLTGNSPDVWKEHLAVTGGHVVTRFPPEPNGYLHVGHAKAMHLDFGLARKADQGICYLRFDDTNPEAESHEFIDAIQSSVAWLGHKPVKVTYSSDYFEQLYEFAMQLIRKDRAFVCHMGREELQTARRAGVPSPWRDRPIAESQRLFEDMRRGKFAEGEAMLRLKIDHLHQNHVMRDPVAFRVKYWPHPRSGDKWCVYPSYDFTHCIVDSLEHVSHSLCTLEFDVRRESYYWLLDALDLYKPLVWEFSRLTLVDEWVDPRTGETMLLATSLSKRRLKRMVETGVARGWDDPRMPTLVGMRRRGFTANALNQFCEVIGVTRAEQRIPFARLENCLRADLGDNAVRAFAVLRPVSVVLTNWADVAADVLKDDGALAAPRHPARPELGNRQLSISDRIYLERDDFRFEDDKSYYGLAPGKEVILRYASLLMRCDEAVRDPQSGELMELRCSVRSLTAAIAADPAYKKPKGVLHWLDQATAVPLEVRLYEWLFCTIKPRPQKEEEVVGEAAAAAAAGRLEAQSIAASQAEGDGEDEDDDDEPLSQSSTYPCTEEVLTGCFVEPGVVENMTDAFQFERVGYFLADKDSKTAGHPVFNRSVTLKESRAKKQVAKPQPKKKAPKAKKKK